MKLKYFLILVCVPLFVLVISFTRANDVLPKVKSSFNGWNNFKIVMGARCKNCCSIEFPEDYGLKSADIDVLVSIIQKRMSIKHDVDCIFPIADDVLDQIKRVAINHNDYTAIRILLFPESIGGFNLTGELADIYETKYLILVLVHKNTSVKLEPAQSREIADKICYAWKNPASDANMDLAQIKRDLIDKNLLSVAEGIDKYCN